MLQRWRSGRSGPIQAKLLQLCYAVIGRIGRVTKYMYIQTIYILYIWCICILAICVYIYVYLYSHVLLYVVLYISDISVLGRTTSEKKAEGNKTLVNTQSQGTQGHIDNGVPIEFVIRSHWHGSGAHREHMGICCSSKWKSLDALCHGEYIEIMLMPQCAQCFLHFLTFP